MGIIKSQLNHKCPPRRSHSLPRPLPSPQELPPSKLPLRQLSQPRLLPPRLPPLRQLSQLGTFLRTSSRSLRETPSSSSTWLTSVPPLRPNVPKPAPPLPPQPPSTPKSMPMLTRLSSMLSVLPRRTAISTLRPRPRLPSLSGPEVSTSSHPSPRRSCSSSVSVSSTTVSSSSLTVLPST